MYQKQKTISKVISKKGIGIHSGKEVNISLKPADINYGIAFKFKNSNKLLKLDPYKVVANSLATVLIDGNLQFSTIEHLLSAFSALGLTNCIIEVDNSEVPILDGSALIWLELLEKVIIEQEAEQKTIKVLKTIELKEHDKSIVLKPTDKKQTSYSFTIDFGNKLPKNMNCAYKFEFNYHNYKNQIAKARTFGFWEDIEYLKSKNLIKGGSLNNAVIFKDKKPINQLRFADEPVRHKILDVIGDFYLLGKPLIANIELFCSGHELNNKAIHKLLENEDCWKLA